MIVTKQWLNEWIDLGAIDTDKISLALNAIGLEVDGLTKIRIPQNVVVGKVISCEKHPNADKLNVCQVDVGENVQHPLGVERFAMLLHQIPDLRSLFEGDLRLLEQFR